MLGQGSPKSSRFLAEQSHRGGEVQIIYVKPNRSRVEVNVERYFHPELTRDLVVSALRVSSDMSFFFRACIRDELLLPTLARWPPT